MSVENYELIKQAIIDMSDEEFAKTLGFLVPPKYHKPKEGKLVFYVNGVGTVSKDHYNKDKMETRESVTKLFATEKEAKDEAKRIKFRLKTERDFMDSSFSLGWDDGCRIKYTFSYDYLDGVIRTTSSRSLATTGPYTSDLKWLERFISVYEEEIIDAYFNGGK